MVVVADPHPNDERFIEADEPSVAMILAGARLARNESAGVSAPTGAARHHAAQERRQLFAVCIMCSAVGLLPFWCPTRRHGAIVSSQ
jgi:hypothetical protein